MKFCSWRYYRNFLFDFQFECWHTYSITSVHIHIIHITYVIISTQINYIFCIFEIIMNLKFVVVISLLILQLILIKSILDILFLEKYLDLIILIIIIIRQPAWSQILSVIIYLRILTLFASCLLTMSSFTACLLSPTPISFCFKDEDILKLAFCTYIKPIPDYSSSAWNPHHKSIKLKAPTNGFSKSIPSLAAHMENLKLLNLQTLEKKPPLGWFNSLLQNTERIYQLFFQIFPTCPGLPRHERTQL